VLEEKLAQLGVETDDPAPYHEPSESDLFDEAPNSVSLTLLDDKRCNKEYRRFRLLQIPHSCPLSLTSYNEVNIRRTTLNGASVKEMSKCLLCPLQPV
jgi:hypothetical protein